MSQTFRAPGSEFDAGNRDSHPTAEEAYRRFIRGALADSQEVLSYAAQLMASVEGEIGDLWQETIDGGDRQLSDRLVDLCNALRRAALVLENEPLIGLDVFPPCVLVPAADPVAMGVVPRLIRDRGDGFTAGVANKSVNAEAPNPNRVAGSPALNGSSALGARATGASMAGRRAKGSR